MFLVIVGDEMKWLAFYGPFKTRKEAVDWADDQEFTSPWKVDNLRSPSAYKPER